EMLLTQSSSYFDISVDLGIPRGCSRTPGSPSYIVDGENMASTFSTQATRSITQATSVQSSPGFYTTFNTTNALDVATNEKATMQNLNDRLASYLERVHSLEKANEHLELKIHQYMESRVSVTTCDHSSYMAIISELQGKILDATRENRIIYLNIDNSKVAVEDFRVKYETELGMAMAVSVDIDGLRKVMDDLSFTCADLKTQADCLKDELMYLKRAHEEDLMSVQTKIGGEINVEVDAAPQEDLSEILAGVRKHYEMMANKSREELESWFQSQVEILNKDVSVSTETLQTSRSEITEVKRTLQGLQIELQSLQSMKDTLEGNLADVQNRYSVMLSGYQSQVLILEEQLVQLRSDLKCQSQEYQMLLDVKTRLEAEIEEYRRLMEGDISSSSLKTHKVVTIVEEVVTGKVVISSSDSYVSSEVHTVKKQI
uniref:IF rod domain-containing protein n=2 Tax=Denticeps clupeoides TaxID=299321 RepID=A0AAY4C9X7_9TELE